MLYFKPLENKHVVLIFVRIDDKHDEQEKFLKSVNRSAIKQTICRQSD